MHFFGNSKIAIASNDPKRFFRATDLPEPLDLLGALGVVAVDGVPLPVVDVDLLHAAEHQLKLALVEILKVERVVQTFRSETFQA